MKRRTLAFTFTLPVLLAITLWNLGGVADLVASGQPPSVIGDTN